MSQIYRKQLIFVLTAIVAFVMVLSYFFTYEGITPITDQIQAWALIIQLIAIGIGAISLIRVHYKTIQKRVPGRWFLSVWLLFFFPLLTLIGLVNLATRTTNPFYDWVFTNVYVQGGQTMYAITGFYIFSAAYRAFRARTLDAALLLIAGCFVLLTNAPVGEVIWSGFPVIGTWLLNYGQVPAMRTFMITAALGLIAFGFRALLGKETGFYGGRME
jgi:hypothetical protein